MKKNGPSKTSRRILNSTSALAIGALVLTACSSGGTTGTSGASQSSTADTSGGTATKPKGDAVYGGKLAINLHQNPPTLDPLSTTSYSSIDTIGLVYSRLITWKTGDDVGYGEFVPAPDLAKSWEVSEDGLTYTLKLRDNVVWQDIPPVNGRSFTAEDVVATFTAIQDEGIQSGLLEPVKSITSPDDYTVVLELKRPSGVMLQNLASPNLFILPKEAFTEGYDRSETVIGTGPFIMEAYDANSGAHFVPNPDYFMVDESGRQLPYLEEFEITYLTDLQARINAFVSGQNDIWFGPISTRKVKEIKAQLPSVNAFESLASTETVMFMNPEVDSLSDLRVRRAINLSLDRCAMGPAVRGGGEVGGIVAPVLAEQSLPDDVRTDMYCSPNPTKAKSLLAEAGYPNGLDLTMLVLDYGQEYLGGPQWFQQDLAKAGIDVELKVVDSTTGKTLASDGDFELAYMVMSPFSNATEYFGNFFEPDSVRNYANVKDPQLLDMMERQASEPDPAKRNKLSHEIEKYVFDNVLNPLPIWNYPRHYFTHDYVQDYYPTMSQGFPMMAHVWVTEK